MPWTVAGGVGGVLKYGARMAEVAYPQMSELIPHTGSMVLVDELTHWEPGQAHCRLTIKPDSTFVVDGRVNTVVSIEYMAQAVAASFGYQGFVGGEGVRVGMIIGCRRFDIEVPYLAVGDDLVIAVREVRGQEDISVFECSIARGEESVASAQLTLYHAERPPEGGVFS